MEDFRKEINEGNFLEYMEYQGNYYGTNQRKIKEISENGKICILDLDLKGAKKIFEKNFSSKFIYLLPQSLEDLRKYLINLNEEDLEVVEKRVN